MSLGLDLQGNTFWEFRDTLSSHKHRMRRIVEYPASTQYSEIRVSPQWHQWLRHTRNDPPSLTEQSQDLIRQRNLKRLAAEADARWAAKQSVLDAPRRRQPLLEMIDDPGDSVQSGEAKGHIGVQTTFYSGGFEGTTGATSTTRSNEGVARERPRVLKEAGAQPPASKTQNETSRVKDMKEERNAWKQTRGGPSEEWQPEAWGGTVTPRGMP
jgi:NADH dehydrogenase [ubiquinone] 1 alpha subcomplex assembly factor 2